MKQSILLLLCLPLWLFGQETKGIHFESGLSWKQLQEKAKAENKYIFVDCYATWCVPCKTMDETIYPLKEVGDIFNQQFISVKIQMDKTNYDDSAIKKWYRDAGDLSRTYSIKSFPTYLFFSPDGRPVHKAVGTRTPDGFIVLAKDAQNPDKQYYNFLANFQPGKLDTSDMKGLARGLVKTDEVLAGKIVDDYLKRIPESALTSEDNRVLMQQFRSNSKIQEIAVNYIKKLRGRQIVSPENFILIRTFKNQPAVMQIAQAYIDKLTKKQLYEKENIVFMTVFLNSSSVKTFDLFYKHGKKVDDAMDQPGYSQGVVDYIITKEYIDTFALAVKKNKSCFDVDLDFNWEEIKKTIDEKFGKGWAERNILKSKVRYSDFIVKACKTGWDKYIQYAIEEKKFSGVDTSMGAYVTSDINNLCYGIFLHSDKKEQLDIATQWMEDLVKREQFKSANDLDTYASLLYKSGRTNEAILMEEKAVAKDSKNKSLTATLEKMKKGEVLRNAE